MRGRRRPCLHYTNTFLEYHPYAEKKPKHFCFKRGERRFFLPEREKKFCARANKEGLKEGGRRKTMLEKRPYKASPRPPPHPTGLFKIKD